MCEGYGITSFEMTSDLCSDRSLIFNAILDNVLDFIFVSNSQ